MKILVPLSTLVFALAVAGPAGLTAPAGRSVWDGVYTAAQADHGRAAYEEHCRSCHGEELAGAEARALDVSWLMTQWAEDNVAGLFQKIRTSMPRGRAGSLSDDSYSNIIAYILWVNGFPAGAQELPSTRDALQAIRIQEREGPGQVPNFALVQVVGCLEPSGGQWLLTGGTKPVRTRNPDASTGSDLKSLDATPPGTSRFQLLNVFPSPEPMRGHRVEAKGLLMRAAEGDRLNVTSIATIASSCGR